LELTGLVTAVVLYGDSLLSFSSQADFWPNFVKALIDLESGELFDELPRYRHPVKAKN
jgi:hypothetical protein